MIFSIWTLKSVKSAFGMEHDQRVIIKFLWNEEADACKIAAKLQPNCMHGLLNMLINFEQSNSGFQRYDVAVKTCMMKFAVEDLL
jgi:hypothetical protein